MIYSTLFSLDLLRKLSFAIVFCLATFSIGYNQTIQGSLLDIDGTGIPNVQVGLKNAQLQTQTDQSGNWSLNLNIVQNFNQTPSSAIQLKKTFWGFELTSPTDATLIFWEFNLKGQVLQKQILELKSNQPHHLRSKSQTPSLTLSQSFDHTQIQNLYLKRSLSNTSDTLVITPKNGNEQKFFISLKDTLIAPIVLTNTSTSSTGWSVSPLLQEVILPTGKLDTIPFPIRLDTIQVDSLYDCRDSNFYHVALWNNLWWMRENLSAKPPIPQDSSWCNSNCKSLGRYYSWLAAQNACPVGWHLPTLSDWESLISLARGDTLAGDRLKDINTWKDGLIHSDSFKISLQAAGLRNLKGIFYNSHFGGYYWLPSEPDTLYLGLGAGTKKIFLESMPAKSGLSVRCVANAGANSFPKTCAQSSVSTSSASLSSSTAPSSTQSSSAGLAISPQWHVKADSLPFDSIFIDTVIQKDSRDQQYFRTITIKHPAWTQVWTAENYKWKPALASDSSWCYNNADTSCTYYGRLYSWNTAQIACPTGFHLPSQEEWNKLISVARGDSIAGKTLKRTATWNETNPSALKDSLHFSAVAAGRRQIDGKFLGMNSNTYFWTSDVNPKDPNQGVYIGMTANYSLALSFAISKNTGFSIRCVQ